MAGIQDENTILQQFMRQQIGILASGAGLAYQTRHDITGIFHTLGLPPRYQRLQIGQEITHCCLAGVKLRIIDFRFQRPEDGQRPVAQGIALRPWNRQQISDHLNRNILCKIGNSIYGFAVGLTCGHVIQQPVNKLPNHHIHASDRTWRECPCNGLSHPCMQGRIIEDQRGCMVFIEK